MESLSFDEYRKVLWSLMGCTVHFGGIEQGHIVLTAKITHQIVEIKHRRDDAFEFVFGWDNDIEIVPGRNDSGFGNQSCDGSCDSIG